VPSNKYPRSFERRRRGGCQSRAATEQKIAERTEFQGALRGINLLNRPVCAAKEASRHLLDGAATPPCEGGEYRAQCVPNTLP